MNETFKRINYFKGFFVQAEDLQQAESYHIEKSRLHNRCLHTPGVVDNYLEGLAVTAAKDGTHVQVAPGCAIDGSGRELFLPVAWDLPLNPKDYNPPTTVYVIISYGEEKVEWRPDKENPEFEGYAFIAERPKCEVVVSEPDNDEVIELARIRLGTDEMRINDPSDKDSPKQSEIDCRFVKYAAAVHQTPPLKALCRKIVKGGSILIQNKDKESASRDREAVLLDKINVQDETPAYLISVCPLEKGHISWHIEAYSGNPETVEYRLCFQNLGETDVNVKWRAYRFDLAE